MRITAEAVEFNWNETGMNGSEVGMGVGFTQWVNLILTLIFVYLDVLKREM